MPRAPKKWAIYAAQDIVDEILSILIDGDGVAALDEMIAGWFQSELRIPTIEDCEEVTEAVDGLLAEIRGQL